MLIYKQTEVIAEIQLKPLAFLKEPQNIEDRKIVWNWFFTKYPAKQKKFLKLISHWEPENWTKEGDPTFYYRRIKALQGKYTIHDNGLVTQDDIRVVQAKDKQKAYAAVLGMELFNLPTDKLVSMLGINIVEGQGKQTKTLYIKENPLPGKLFYYNCKLDTVKITGSGFSKQEVLEDFLFKIIKTHMDEILK